MVGLVQSASLIGMESSTVWVEADFGDGFPQFEMVGLLSSEVKEARERVRTALKNSGHSLPCGRYMVNLSPANLRKTGNCFDLPVAVAILVAIGVISASAVSGYMFLGELSLTGELRPVLGMLSFADAARKQGWKRCIVPKENEKEAALVKDIQVYGFSCLSEVVKFLQGHLEKQPVQQEEPLLSFQDDSRYAAMDFSEINGQESLKRAALVACAGFHNMLMVGPPGSGKSMLAKRLPTILPKLTLEEAIEISKIYSICGLLDHGQPLVLQRPFRTVHHTVPATSLAGGGKFPSPGEISLAHRGILFLDEMPEFHRYALEVLRQPIEDKRIVISRLHGNYVFPADFMLVAAMNPCNCGFYPDRNRCQCSEGDVRRYQSKISRPLLDRIDIRIDVPAVPYEAIVKKKASTSSAQLRQQVERAREIQSNRYRQENILFNSQLTGKQLKKYCRLGPKESQLMQQTLERLNFSVRAYDRILKVARTIADLDGKEDISVVHLSEALCYRNS